MSFAEQTAVQAQGTDIYETTLHEGWDIGSVTNGGYVMALAVRAMLDAVDKPDPIAVNAHFERPGAAGPATIRIDRGREGRTLSTVSAVLYQNDKEIIRATGTFGDLEAMEGPTLIRSEPPDIAPIDECIHTAPTADQQQFYPPPFTGRFEIHHDPRRAGFATGTPDGQPEMGGWLRLHDDEPVDAVALTMFADSYPPTIFNTDLPVGWAPTVELTVHYRRRPVSPALMTTYDTAYIFGGMFSGDVEIWDPVVGLVAEARQIALLPKV